MKKNKAYNATKYTFQEGESVLIDANVLIYLFPPTTQPPPNFAKNYSQALKNLLTAKARPVIDSLVLSEYINRYLRLEYNSTWSATYTDFKSFRNSGDFVAVGNSAIIASKEVLKIASRCDTIFSKVDIQEVLSELGNLDFNDGVLVEMCRLQGWKLLTNDGDLIIGGIEVLTTNHKLITACP